MSNSLKDLKREWYQRIKDDGFLDIEYPSGHLKKFNASLHKMEEAKKYFSVCNDFLNQYLFDSELDRNIWDCHAQGYSIRQTADIIKVGSSKVRYRLDKLKLIMEYWRKM